AAGEVWDETVGGAKERRLSGARRARDQRERPLLDGETHAREGGDGRVRITERDVLEAEGVGAHGASPERTGTSPGTVSRQMAATSARSTGGHASGEVAGCSPAWPVQAAATNKPAATAAAAAISTAENVQGSGRYRVRRPRPCPRASIDSASVTASS